MEINERDAELDIPNRLASIVAEMTSGVPGAIPEDADEEMAHSTYVVLRRMIDDYYI